MKKELEGFITADVVEYILSYERTYTHSGFRYGRVIIITFKIDDPRCIVNIVRDKDKYVYRFTKSTKKLDPIYGSISIYTRGIKKRNILRYINGAVYRDAFDLITSNRKNSCVLAFLHDNVQAEDVLGNFAYPGTQKLREYKYNLYAKDIKDPGSILRYLFKTTKEKLTR